MKRAISVLLMFTSISCGLKIRYERTSVIQNLERCNNVFSTLIRKHCNCFDIEECFQYCSDDLICKRFMYDLQTNSCFLYDSGENCTTVGTATSKVCYIQKSKCNETTCIGCALGYYGDRCQYIVKDCSDKANRFGVYDKRIMSFIKPNENGPVIEVKCMNNGRTIIQCRRFGCNEVNFNRTWNEYVNGFGFSHTEYWIGLKNIHSIIQHSSKRTNLRVCVTGGNNFTYKDHYGNLTIGPEVENYKINIGKALNDYEMDILMHEDLAINGSPFSTYDRDSTTYSCPSRFGGGWWYPDHPDCSRTNLNGKLFAENPEGIVRLMNGFVNGTDIKFISLTLTPASTY